MVSGVDYPKDRLGVILRATERNIEPPVKTHHQWADVDDVKVLIFEVDWSPEVHQLTDGRYLLRIGDQNLPFPASDISAMKEGKRRRVTEARFTGDREGAAHDFMRFHSSHVVDSIDSGHPILLLSREELEK